MRHRKGLRNLPSVFVICFLPILTLEHFVIIFWGYEKLGDRAHAALDASGMNLDDIKTVLVERASREEGEDIKRLELLAES